MKPYSECSFRAKSTDCGVNDNLFLSVLIGDIQEAAEVGANDIGFSTDFVFENNCCWIVLKTKIHINRVPKWRDTYTIKTWHTGLDRISFNREYEVISAEGEVLAYATSTWILADAVTHRLVIPNKIPNFPDCSPQDTRLVFGYMSPKLKFPNLNELTSVVSDPILSKYADFSELDHNHHVNNSRYIAWVYDALYKSDIDTSKVTDIAVNYTCEVKSGEKVSIYLVNEENIIKVYGYKDDSTKVFAVEVTLG